MCGHDAKPVFLQTGHHFRAKTNYPIFGILTQPIPQVWLRDETVYNNEWATFFEASHAEYLQAGGARVVPVDYRMDDQEFMELLTQLNGLYIPGDTKDTFDNEQFIYAVKLALDWSQQHNMQEGKHFPVIGNSYGMLAMLKSQLPNLSPFKDIGFEQVHAALQ